MAVLTFIQRSPVPLALGGGAVAALAVALISQYGFGYAPCELCIWQRWPYVAVIAFTGFAVAFPSVSAVRVLMWMSVAALAVDSGIAGFHVGVEQGWWEGLSGCGAPSAASSIDDLRAQIMAAPLVRCTDVSLSVLGLSMAAWNGLFAAGLAIFGAAHTLKETAVAQEAQ